MRRPSHSNRFRVITVLVAAGGMAAAVPGFAQEQPVTGIVGVNLVGPLFGVYSGSLELALDQNWSIVVVATYFNAKDSLAGILIEVAGVNPDDYELWRLGAAVGAHYFLTERAPIGLFAGVSLDSGYLHARYQDSVVDAVQIGARAHFGYRVLWGPVAITPRLLAGYHHVLADTADITDSFSVGGIALGMGVDLGIAF